MREEPSFRARLTGAALLRRSVYEDVVADDGTTGQAVGVVVLASLAQGFALFAEAGAAAVVLIALAILLAAIRWAPAAADAAVALILLAILLAAISRGAPDAADGLLRPGEYFVSPGQGLSLVLSEAAFPIAAAAVAAVGLAVWAASASIAWFAGTRVLRRPATDASWDEVARGLAFAEAPRLLLALAPLVRYAPGGAPDDPAAWAGDALLVAWAAAAVWVLAAWAAALRVALGFGAGRAAAAAVLAWLPPTAFAALAAWRLAGIGVSP